MPTFSEGLPIVGPDVRERKTPKLTYHHSRPLDSVVHGIVKPISPLIYDSELDIAAAFDGAYRWLESKVGFYPLFMAVGRTEDDLRTTGYQRQWSKLIAKDKNYREYRQKGQFPNNVLFSYSTVSPQGVFTDLDNWSMVINESDHPEELKKLTPSILKPSWNRSDWITLANKRPQSVQLVVPFLDLRQAEQVTVRNNASRDTLIKMGFSNVVVARLTLGNTAI